MSLPLPFPSGRPAAPEMGDRQIISGCGQSDIANCRKRCRNKREVGQVVHEGDVILVIEAMKMNTSIAAPGNGKITAIPVAVGDSVREGQVLAELEA
jgi:nitrogen regulatory protein PII